MKRLACLLLSLAPALAGGEEMAHEMDHAHMFMPGTFGPYSMTREASGTSWQPESTAHEGIHKVLGDWSVMVHGYADGVYDRQGGPRGGEKGFSESMFMVMGQRALGPGTLGLRAMGSLDPAMGPSGYPLLLQTGETGDGNTGLVDRQHPHDFFMELAASYSYALGDDSSVFGYLGLPGEPALGPPAFMHRFSGMDDPEAPITHHWLDSTHVSFGVATVGLVWRDWKLEGSTFRGREPDKFRWETQKPDPSILISDGKRFLFYTPPFDQDERGQLVIRKTSQVQSRLATALLAGNFSALPGAKISCSGENLFELSPKRGTAGDLDGAEIRINPQDELIDRVVLHHNDGNRSEITLSQIFLGKAAGDEMFRFHPIPPKTDVIEE